MGFNYTNVLKHNIKEVILVYDVTNAESFDNIKREWWKILRFINTNCIKVIVGNKCDDITNRVIDFKTGKEYADSIGALFFETSAKYSINTNNVFFVSAKKFLELQTSAQNDQVDKYQFSSTKQVKKEKCSLQ